MILIIDNYDSFTYNLVQYLGTLYSNIEVYRNDRISIKAIDEMSPKAIIISPGPKNPQEAGISMEVIKKFSGKLPILGVCLGHQSIAEVFGGETIHAKKRMHGKTSLVTYHEHLNSPLFKGISNPFQATRYHSLVTNRKKLPSTFNIVAETEDKVIMAIQSKVYKHLYGVQFHPESICTPEGMNIIKNFYNLL